MSAHRERSGSCLLVAAHVLACLGVACGAPKRPSVAPAAAKTESSAHVAASTPVQTASSAATPAPAAKDEDAPAAAAPPPPDPTAQLLALDGSHSTSLGAPGHGTLKGAVALPDSGPGYVHNQERPDNARYGTVELVQKIVKAAAVVERELPGSVLVVNDLGLENGGPIRQHGSHQSGRDADILFYSLDQHGTPLPSVGVPIEPDGSGYDYKDLASAEDDVPVRIDAPRTWRFVQAMLEDESAELQRIFIVEHVRRMLLTAAEQAHAPAALRDRFADLSCQPQQPHDDHMHVRLFCSPEDIGRGCYDKPPLYPWHKLALEALGLKAIFEPARNRTSESEEVKARTTTRTQAKKRAGPMHRDVRAFLKRRESWAKQPHPGRKYCP